MNALNAAVATAVATCAMENVDFNAFPKVPTADVEVPAYFSICLIAAAIYLNLDESMYLSCFPASRVDL